MLWALEAANGMTVYKDYWMSGTTLYSSASTDTDGVGETASASISIYGPSGSTGASYWCTYYNAYVSTSLALTTSGDHTVESNHWTTSVASLIDIGAVEITFGPEVNYALTGGGIDYCNYAVSCPGSGGGSQPICSNAPSSVTAPKSPGVSCGAFPYAFIEWGYAVKLPIITNRFCWNDSGGPRPTNVQHGCSTPSP